jgi:bifunctional oligoribonuclease and PAP phosphatase NrnA
VKDSRKDTKELQKLLSTSENILLICHINPDGDAIGSQLALYHYLKSRGMNVDMFAPNFLQNFLKWMPGADLINIFIEDRKKCRMLIERADLIIMLDFNHPGRLGEAESLVVESKAKKVIIDHHLDPFNFADLIISEPSKCSTSELVHELLCEISDSQLISKPYAECIYVGIVTDTGNFVHGSYTSLTLRIVAELMEMGIEREKILDQIYNNYSSDRIRLQGYALNNRMVVMPEFKTAYIYLSKADLKEYKHVKGDTEGFVNIPLSIKGIRFSILFIEKDGFVKLSFRSKGKFPTNEFAARYFSGGGHMNASGGEYSDKLDNTIDYFKEGLKEYVSRFED